MKKLTVLMPVYNGQKYLREAIDSILNQTYKDFEFLIIDDASTDESVKVILSYTDSRIRLVKNEKNLGLIGALNKGLGLATGEYVARMDADDISMPNRLKVQLDFLLNNTAIVALGSGMDIISENGESIGYQPALEINEAIKLALFATCPFVHPSVLFIKEKVLSVGGYNPEAKYTEDYDLWIRLSKVGDFANINKPLIKYRITPTGISISKKREQIKESVSLTDKLWQGKSDPMPGMEWDKLWYKRAKTRKEKEYFSFLHLEFSRRYFLGRKYVSSMNHARVAFSSSPIISCMITLMLIKRQLSLKE